MNKDLLKVSGLIALIVGIIYCFTIVGAVIGIPIIIGGNKFREYADLSDEELYGNKDNILIWSIVFLIICTISGILSLIVYLGLENPNLFNSSSSNSNKYDDLERINKLYKDKVITKEEYEMEKQRILSK